MESEAQRGRSSSSSTFVVSLSFAGVHRGLAGPFVSEDAAADWIDELLDGEPGWSWALEPVVAPSTLPSASARRAAKARRRRHLHVVRDEDDGDG
jgi:hypothetical protein